MLQACMNSMAIFMSIFSFCLRGAAWWDVGFNGNGNGLSGSGCSYVFYFASRRWSPTSYYLGLPVQVPVEHIFPKTIFKHILKYCCMAQYWTQLISMVPVAFPVTINGRTPAAAAVFFTDLKLELNSQRSNSPVRAMSSYSEKSITKKSREWG